jgi:DNA processing protein
MTRSDTATVIAALALQKSGTLSEAGTRDLLLKWWRDGVVVTAIDDALDRAGVARPTVNASVNEAEREIVKAEKLGIIAVSISSAEYPASLRGIVDAPPVIYVRGQMSALQWLPGVSVVGTRKASPHGRLIAGRIAEYLSAHGWAVVSGLALGIDAEAHEGALVGQTPTIAVLAHGLEKAQPTSNQPLAERILEAGGAWVAEHGIGVPAKPANFVLRNRIQVGLSCASIIVEGEEKSGSRTQADFCLRNKRTLFAVLPERGSKVSTVSALPKMLVSMQGATPIYSREDYPSMLEAVEKAARSLDSVIGILKFARASTVHGILRTNRASTDALSALEKWKHQMSSRDFHVLEDTDTQDDDKPDYLVARLRTGQADEGTSRTALDELCREFGIAREAVARATPKRGE